jgi:hypothetical protein
MLKSVLTYTKTGNTTWDYFLNPSTLPVDNPMFETWNQVFPMMYGPETNALFPGVTLEFEVVSAQELKCQQTVSDVETLDAWINYITSCDLSPATDVHTALEIMYPGESISQTLKIIEAPVGIQDSTAYQWANNEPNIAVIHN